MEISPNKERYGWRDKDISERHRLYGEHIRAVDIDFLLVEYDNLQPAALVEYKGGAYDTTSANLVVLRRLADKADLPFFVVQYEKSDWSYWVTPYNELAKQWITQETMLTEEDYVFLLYQLRGIATIPPYIQRRIRNGIHQLEGQSPGADEDQQYTRREATAKKAV